MKTETYKILLVGDKDVGKTSLLNRYIENYFTLNSLSTIGIDMMIKQIIFNNTYYKLQLWDLAGNEKYRNIVSAYFSKCDIIIFTYDITDRSTFENLTNWLDDIKEYNNSNLKNIVKILVGTKLDLEDDRQVSYEEAKKFAENSDIVSNIECSAKTDVKVRDIFDIVIDELVKLDDRDDLEIDDEDDISDIQDKKNKKYDCSCCTIS